MLMVYYGVVTIQLSYMVSLLVSADISYGIWFMVLVMVYGLWFMVSKREESYAWQWTLSASRFFFFITLKPRVE